MIQGWFEFLHYSRLQFCALAMTLTAASGRVLVGRIEWEPVLMVGLATYSIYSLDNLLDWSGEKHLLETIRSKWSAYFTWCVFTIPLALVGTLLLAVRGPIDFLILLGGLGIISVSHVLLTHQSKNQGLSIVALWVKDLIDSVTWALVVVLIPVRYAGQHIVAQVIMAIAFIWQLSWVGVMVWDLTGSATGGHRHSTKTLSTVLGEHHMLRLLRMVSASSLVLAVVDVLLGYFPWYNISVTSGSIVNLILLSLWKKFRKIPLFYCNLLFMANTLCGLMVIAVYVIVE